MQKGLKNISSLTALAVQGWKAKAEKNSPLFSSFPSHHHHISPSIINQPFRCFSSFSSLVAMLLNKSVHGRREIDFWIVSLCVSGRNEGDRRSSPSFSCFLIHHFVIFIRSETIQRWKFCSRKRFKWILCLIDFSSSCSSSSSTFIQSVRKLNEFCFVLFWLTLQLRNKLKKYGKNKPS